MGNRLDVCMLLCSVTSVLNDCPVASVCVERVIVSDTVGTSLGGIVVVKMLVSNVPVD